MATDENLCPDFRATGRDIDGGYAEFMRVPAGFVHPIPDRLSDAQAAPMLCAGAIGLRSLRLTELRDGQVLGLTGFGASNHLVLSLAGILYPESPVMVWARDPGQREQAMALGADAVAIGTAAMVAIGDNAKQAKFMYKQTLQVLDDATKGRGRT